MTPVDRLVELRAGESATGYRNVPSTLDVFDTHFPSFPVLPGVLTLDSVTALCEAVVGAGWALEGARRLRYRGYVQPGDRLDLAVRVTESSEDAITLSATATVDGRTVATFGEIRYRRAGDQ